MATVSRSRSAFHVGSSADWRHRQQYSLEQVMSQTRSDDCSGPTIHPGDVLAQQGVEKRGLKNHDVSWVTAEMIRG